MNAVLVSKENNVAKFTMAFTAEEFDAALDKAYKAQRGKIEVPGFRKGKAPRSVIEKRYGEGIFFEDAIDNCLADGYPAALDQLALEPVDRPDLQFGEEKLEKGKEVMIGLDRKFKVDKSLFDELAASDVRKYEYFEWADNMIVIHGTADEMVPISDSEKFCEDNVIELVPVEGADHPFRNPKLMDTAIHTIVEFFSE